MRKHEITSLKKCPVAVNLCVTSIQVDRSENHLNPSVVQRLGDLQRRSMLDDQYRIAGRDVLETVKQLDVEVSGQFPSSIGADPAP